MMRPQYLCLPSIAASTEMWALVSGSDDTPIPTLINSALLIRYIKLRGLNLRRKQKHACHKFNQHRGSPPGRKFLASPAHLVFSVANLFSGLDREETRRHLNLPIP
jgi:hypothetical protein